MGLTADSAQRNLSPNSTVVCSRRSLLVGMIFILLCESAIHAKQRALPPKNLLLGAAWKYSIDNGETFSATPPTVSPGKSATIIAMVSFTLKTPPVCDYLELSRLNFRQSEPIYELNGAKLKGPLEGMQYRTIPGGVTHIMSGGSGAPLSKKAKNADLQNPYSRVFASKLHYCLFEVAGGTARMKALAPQGKVIDQREWKSRPR